MDEGWPFVVGCRLTVRWWIRLTIPGRMKADQISGCTKTIGLREETQESAQFAKGDSFLMSLALQVVQYYGGLKF